MTDVTKKPEWNVGRGQRSNARRLRRNSTDAERAIWSQLRAHRMGGFGFRRQVPVGPYVADFLCHEAKIVIEIDGGQHFTPKGMRHDQERERYLEALGFRVLRFDNRQVLTERPGVLEAIAAALAAAPSQPSPASGGGQRAARSGFRRTVPSALNGTSYVNAERPLPRLRGRAREGAEQE